MPDDVTKVAGLPIPSIRRSFCGWLASRYGRPHLRGGRHCRDGQPEVPRRPLNFWALYYWSWFAVFVSATILAAIRWVEDYHLFILGAPSFAAASWGRIPVRRSGSQWVRFHITGMESILSPVADGLLRGQREGLPLWKELPSITYWLLPIGMPIIVRAVLRHVPVRRADPQHSTMAE